MRTCKNFVDLEKRCKMNIWSQKSALLQLRTDRLREQLFSSPTLFVLPDSEGNAPTETHAFSMVDVVVDDMAVLAAAREND